MSILFVFPSEKVKNIFYFDESILYLTYEGWEYYDTSTKTRNIHPFSLIEKNLVGIELSEIRNKFNWYSPIFSRWLTNYSEHEHHMSNCILLTTKISSGLVHYKVKKLFFFTSVAHHLDTISVSISASLLNLQQIFLYCIVFEGRLLPLYQNQNIGDRVINHKYVSSFIFDDIIDKFYYNKINNLVPNHAEVTNLKKSFSYTIFILLTSYLISFAIKIIKGSKKNIFDFYKKTSFLDNFRLILLQKSFLKFYKKNKRNIIESNKLLNSQNPILLIAAHYQPEATSFPEGYKFSNHLEIVLKLRQLGYKDVIAYKEHPTTCLYYDNIVKFTKVGMYRSKNYAYNLLNLNCIFIDESTPLLINGNANYFPVTITGTIAIERSLAGLHTIIVGEPWYKGLPGTIHIDDLTLFEKIDSKLITQDKNIAIGARKFLLKILNNHTLNNVIGIGSGIELNNLKFDQEFENSLRNLIQ